MFKGIALTMLILVCGCQRGVCDYKEMRTLRAQQKAAARDDKLGDFWGPHKDLLVSPVPCETDSSEWEEVVSVDFDPEPKDPRAVVLEKLESKGWARTNEKHDANSFDATLKKDGQELIVTGQTFQGRTKVSYTLPKPQKP